MENKYPEIGRQLRKYGNVQGLMRYVNENTLYEQHLKQQRNKATGIDKVTKDEYDKNVKSNLKVLIDKMKTYSYRPLPVRRTYIPKANGKLRPLGIPAYEDKLVQGAMASVLTDIYERIFLNCSYGFRPNRDCHQAIKELDRIIMTRKVNYIVEADIKGFFDNVNHEWLLKFLQVIVKDKDFLRYIRRFLISGCMEEEKFIEIDKGTPQGGLISPILANVYLHYVLDLWFKVKVVKEIKGEAYLIRYADDFVCCFENKEEAEKFYTMLKERLGKFGLEIEESKTRIFPFGRNNKKKEKFDFLGFTVSDSNTRNGKYRVGYRTSEKKSKVKFQKINELIKALYYWMKPKGIIKKINRVLTGYYNYYGISFNMPWLKEIYEYTIKRLKWYLSRRSQKGKLSWDKMNRIIEYNPIVRPQITYSLW